MADPQQIVDEVRFRLQSGDCELDDELKRLAGEYAGLCHVVNTRLRRCGDFLKQGLRAEALQLADAEPNLLESFAVIDFPERSEWDDIAALYQLPSAEPLLSDIAQDLNEAYSFQQPLAQLLDRHRLLALCRAPLSQRLPVVRKLADADPGSRFWEEDLREFEDARCKQIEGEARAALAGNDEGALASLLNEILSAGWRHPPAPAVIQSVKSMAMQVVGDQLKTAFANRNLDRARLLREQWQAVAPRSAAAGSGRSGDVAAALKWLAAEDSKSHALQTQYARLEDLERMLVQPDASLAELTEARNELLKSRSNIPEGLSSRLDARVRLLRKQMSSRRRQMISAVSAGIALFVGLFAFMIWSSLRHSAADRIAKSADQFVARGNLHQARQLLESNEWMSTTEQYLAVHSKLVEAEQKEEARAGQFRAAIDRARSGETPAKAELAIAEADKLAATIDEHGIVDEVKGRWNRQLQEAGRNADDRFQQQLSDTNDLLDRLELLQAKSVADAAFTDLLKVAEKKCRELRQISVQVKPAFALHVDSADARLARITTAVANRDRRAAIIERLTSESSTISGAVDPEARVRQFGLVLQEFCDAFPADPKSAEFAEVVKDVDSWRGIARWQQLGERWQSLLPRSIKEARVRAGECNEWLQEHSKSASATILREYLSYLSSAVAREEDSSGDTAEGLRQKLLNLFSGPLVEDVEMFVTADGERFYVRGKYEWADGKPIRYIAGVRGEMKSTTIKHADGTPAQSRESPQSVFRRKVRGIMASTTLTTWDKSLYEIAEALRIDRDLDAFLRYYFLLRVLNFAHEGDSILAVELEPIIKALQGADVDLAARWMDPRDAEAITARKKAQVALNSVASLKSPFENASKRGMELNSRLFEKVIPVGWLAIDQQGRWDCLSAANIKIKPGSTLWMVVPIKGQLIESWIKVGVRDAGNRFVLEKGSDAHLRQGRLLFVRGGTMSGDVPAEN